MKLNILSDLHLGFGAMDWPVNDADVVVLAGDVARPREAVAWALKFDKPVLYVPGNHEFYGSSIDGALDELQRLCMGTQVQVLDQREVVLGGVRFLGATLWTDFELFDNPQQRATAKSEARRLMRDFSRIRLRESSAEIFTPDDSVNLFRCHSAWLERRLAERHDGPTVVITHHAPSRHSIHPRFADSLLNACFVSDAAHLLDADRVSLWIHGHTHDSFDHRVNGTRVVCNPRGYARGGVNENPAFDPHFAIEVNAPSGPLSALPGRRERNDLSAHLTGRESLLMEDCMHGTALATPTTAIDSMADSDLAARAASGDDAAFEHIMRRHNRLLFRTARSILKSDAEAEDALQEAYLRAWRSLGSFRSEARLSTWLVRIVINEALGRLRRRSAQVLALDATIDLGDVSMEDVMEGNPDERPDRTAMRTELRTLMEACIDALPEAFRTVFMLRAVEEMSVEEVSVALGLPEATVRTRFFRARGLLRERLARDIDHSMADAFSFDGARCDRIVAGVMARLASHDGAVGP